MDRQFNELTPAQHERLSFLLEELGEAQQAIGKVLRHGYESYNPDDTDAGSNRYQLAKELGHVRCAMIMLCNGGELTKELIHASAKSKAVAVLEWMHHQ